MRRFFLAAGAMSALALSAVVAPAAAATDPTASPGPSASAPAGCPNPDGGDCLGPLAAGTYTANNFVAPISYSVPAGWANEEDLPGNFLLVAPGDTLDGVDAGTSNYIGIYWDATPPKQDCSGTPDQDVGRNAEAIANWLASLPDLDASDPTPVTVGGLKGFGIDVTVDPKSKKTCPGGPVPAVDTMMGDSVVSQFQHGLSTGLAYRYLLLDGTRPIAVELGYTPHEQTFAQYVAQVQPIIDSLRFASRERGPDATLPESGTYATEVTPADLEAVGFDPESAQATAGTFGLTLAGDQLTLHWAGQAASQDCQGVQTLDRDLVLVKWVANCGGDFGYEWGADGADLTIGTPDYPGLVSSIMAHTWTKANAPASSSPLATGSSAPAP